MMPLFRLSSGDIARRPSPCDVPQDRQMWFYVQMWLPVWTVALTAAICFSVASFIMGQPKPQR
jgi:hypothetical protein